MTAPTETIEWDPFADEDHTPSPSMWDGPPDDWGQTQAPAPLADRPEDDSDPFGLPPEEQADEADSPPEPRPASSPVDRLPLEGPLPSATEERPAAEKPGPVTGRHVWDPAEPL